MAEVQEVVEAAAERGAPPTEPVVARGRERPPAVLFVAMALLGIMLGTAARVEPPPSARLGRTDLVGLVRGEQARNDSLAKEVERLRLQVERHEAAVGRRSRRVAALEKKVAAAAPSAGFSALAGVGVTATLDDSPLQQSPSGNLNDLVVHEQDLQAVVNALWAGGAEAMTVNGERIVTTSAIRCVGNVLLLHGRVYSPPYVVAAIGDPVALRTALDRDDGVARYRAAGTAYGVLLDVRDAELTLPPYDGPPPVHVARVVRGEA